MRFSSPSFAHGQPIPVEFTAGKGDGFAPNRNPHLVWDDVPDGVKSFALLVVDHDVPTVREMIGRTDVMIPHDQLRTKFVHWTMVDIPANVREIAAGNCSDQFVNRGKAHPQGPAGARQGLNDYTAWFADHPDMAGEYLGYDGPFPPFNDMRIHRYFFRLLALRVASLRLPEHFNDDDIVRAAQGHVLADEQFYGIYTLNPTLVGKSSS